MVTGQPSARARTGRSPPAALSTKSAWPAYLGITGFLVLIVVALASGIIWHNLRKSTELLVAAAERQMAETGEKSRIEASCYTIPFTRLSASLLRCPRSKPLGDNGHPPIAMLLRVLRF